MTPLALLLRVSVPAATFPTAAEVNFTTGSAAVPAPLTVASREIDETSWKMPSFTVPTFSLENNGQYFAAKWKLPWVPGWRFLTTTMMVTQTS